MNPILPETEPLLAYSKLWGRSGPLRWCDGLDLDFLKSKRTLWIARDFFRSVPNRGICAHVGIALKTCGFSHRVVRGLIDVRRETKLPQCTLWRTSRAPLPTILSTEPAGRGWRSQYHWQLLTTASVSDLKTYAKGFDWLTESLCRDWQLDDPKANPNEFRDYVESLRASRLQGR